MIASLIVQLRDGAQARLVSGRDRPTLDAAIRAAAEAPGVLCAQPVYCNVEAAGPTRRSFLERMAMAVAAALLQPALAGCDDPSPLEADGETRWTKATCRFCGTGCGVMVGVKDGAVTSVAGDEESPVNRGRLCAKGANLAGLLGGEDRLMTPLIRDGEGFRAASWDEALDLVAARLTATIEKPGPQFCAMYGSGQWTIQEGYAASKFMRAGVRSNHLDANARLCMASAVVGFLTSFGQDEPMGCYDDLERGDVFVMWGNNMAEAHPVLFARLLEHKRANPHVRIVDLAPRYTATSEAADEFLAVQPQSDLAIANGIAHLLVSRGQVDRDFIDRHCVFRRGREQIGYGLEDGFTFVDDEVEALSFEAFAAYVAEYTPEEVERISGVPPDRLTALADLYGDPELGVVSLWCMGINQSTRGTWANNLLNNLHLLTGKISRPGNNPFALTGQPSAAGTVREVGTLAHALPSGRLVTNAAHRREVEEAWDVEPGTIPGWVGRHAVAMFRGIARERVRWMWIQGTNPLVSLPKLKRWREAMEAQKAFIVVSDIYHTPTTALADVVLPAALWVEKEGCFGNAERRTQHWAQAVEPPGEARSDLWQLMEVARRAGFGELLEYDEPERELYEEYRALTVGKGKDVASYDELIDTRGMRWPVIDGKETLYRYREGHDPYVPEGAEVMFYGKPERDDFERVWTRPDTDGRAIIWARPYEPPPEVPDTRYPLWLTTGRVLEHWHTGTMTRRVAALAGAVPEALVELHPDDAAAYGVSNGDRVRLSSRRGSITLPARVGQAGRGQPVRGVVFVPFFDDSVLVNLLTLDALCPLSKQPDYKRCAVRVELDGGGREA